MNLRFPHPYCGIEMSWEVVCRGAKVISGQQSELLGAFALSGQNNLLISP